MKSEKECADTPRILKSYSFAIATINTIIDSFRPQWRENARKPKKMRNSKKRKPSKRMLYLLRQARAKRRRLRPRRRLKPKSFPPMLRRPQLDRRRVSTSLNLVPVQQRLTPYLSRQILRRSPIQSLQSDRCRVRMECLVGERRVLQARVHRRWED